MSISDLLTRMRGHRIRLWVEDNQLRFEAPKGALTPALRENLGARKSEIIAFLKQVDTTPIQAVKRQVSRGRQIAPTSYSQQRLWFIQELEPDNTAYNVASAFRLQGPADLTALATGMRDLVLRHETLATFFSKIDGEPHQIISQKPAGTLPVIDLSDHANGLTQAKRIATREAHTPFNLSDQPPLRCHLLRLARTDHVLLISLHHIVSDGWSHQLLGRDLSKLYEAALRARPTTLPGLPIQYADFVYWQRKKLAENKKDLLAYWKNRLQGAPPVLQLPRDRQRTTRASQRGAIVPFRLAKPLTRTAREAGATLFTTVQAAFAILLSRYSGEGDIVFGAPMANRDRSEIEGLIGAFVNTIVLRHDLCGAQSLSFAQWLKRVSQISRQDFAHADLPFELLVAECNPDRRLDRTPLVQVVLELDNLPPSGLKLPGLKLQQLFSDSVAVRFDLEVHLWTSADGLEGIFTYNTDIFDAATMQQMARHFQNLLETVATDPQQPVANLPMPDPQEQAELLRFRNQTDSHYPPQSLVALFETQVQRTPQSIALQGFSCKAQDVQLSYESLNAEADLLARHLMGLGVGPGAIVAICLEQSTPIVCLIAVLKAGAAYLSLDPKNPTERLAQLLTDASVNLLLTHSDILETLPSFELNFIQTVTIDELNLGPNGPRPDRKNDLDSLAYITYTSGSTGKPKGASVPHRAVVRLLFGVDYVDFTRVTSMLQMAPLYFDASTFEVWGALLHGARLSQISERVPTVEKLAHVLEQYYIDTLWLTATLFNEVIDLAPLCLAGLRQLVVGGEALSVSHVCSALSHLQNVRLVNGYGPSESTTFSCCYPIPRNSDPSLNSIPIGQPIGNTRVYIVDQRLRLVADGLPGELAISGHGLAWGYMNQPQQTAEKFVPDPFGPTGSRLYRTGDRVRFHPEHKHILFMDRIDSQVKLRGYRIELGEIEAKLAKAPAVTQVAAVLGPGKTLIAYVVRQGPGTDTNDLREFLKAKLPSYMLPSAIITQSDLPRTRSGKLDRKTLAERPLPMATVLQTHAKTPDEEIMCAIWARVLQLDDIATDADFFELGGHSLLAIRVFSQIREIFQLEMPLSALFETPTVSALCGELKRMRNARQGPAPPPMKRAEVQASYPMSSAQRRLWLLDRLEGAGSTYHIPFILELSGTLDLYAMETAFTLLRARHAALRTRFITAQDGEPRQVIEANAMEPLQLIDLRGLAHCDSISRQLSQREAQRPFNLDSGPCMRTQLLQTGTTRYALLITLHHIIMDGWSLPIFARDLSAFYRAGLEAIPAVLPGLDIQYADYATWQQQRLAEDSQNSLLAWWRQQLDGAPSLLHLPTDRPRPEVRTYAGAVTPVLLDAQTTQALKRLGRDNGATLFMTLQAALLLLLARYSGDDDILLGSPMANRDRAETEALIGFFVNILVLRHDLSKAGAGSFAHWLREVRQTTLEAYNHAEMPFELLIAELRPERRQDRSPLLQVILELGNTEAAELNLPGLETAAREAKTGTVKFDLEVHLAEHQGKLSGAFAYNKDLFSAARIAHMVRDFNALLQNVIQHQDRPLWQLPLPAQAQPSGLTDNPVPPLCIHHLFEARAAATPDAIALDSDSGLISYAQLNIKAEQLAATLRSMGVGADGITGVCLQRSSDLIIALIAVLKAGAAYLPLDPSFPLARLSFILQDSGITSLVTSADLLESLPAMELGFIHTCLVEDKHQIQPARSSVWPQNLAYINYTSGSTGQPKGVALCHQSVHRLVHGNYFDFENCSAILHMASVSFDASTFEIWGSLLHGARCVVYPKTPISHEGLERVLATRQVDGLLLTPALLNTVIDNKPEMLRPVRQCLTGGEHYSLDHVRRALACLPNTQFIHVYGPTESTVLCSYYPIPSPLPRPQVPIGVAITGSGIQLMDQTLNPVLFGLTGHLHIAGEGLARGYLRQPGLTAERFVPDPLGNGTRLYGSGDLARCLEDGQFHFQGRRDNQVKIHGFRIEPGEIEALLKQHPGVDNAVVLQLQQGKGRGRLAAYIKVTETYLNSSICDLDGLHDDLLTYLKKRLPAYMLPAFLVPLKTLPLMSNQKLDLPALAQIDPTVADQAKRKRRPRNSTELRLVLIWEKLLGVDDIGIDDNFFDVGGHSLLVIRMLTEIRTELGVELPVSGLLQAHTIVHLAELLKRQANAPAEEILFPFKADGEGEPLYLLHGSGGRLFCYTDLVHTLSEDQPIYGIQSPLLLDNPPQFSSIGDMAQYMLDRLENMGHAKPTRLAGWSLGGLIAFEMAQRLRSTGHEVTQLIAIDTHLPQPGLDRGLAACLALYAREFAEEGPLHDWIRAEHLQGLEPEAAFRVIAGRAQQAGILDADLEPQDMERLTRTAMINRMAMQNYRPKPYPGPLTLIQAGANPAQTRAEQRAGWQGLVHNKFTAITLAGDHHEVIREPLAPELIAAFQGKNCKVT